MEPSREEIGKLRALPLTIARALRVFPTNSSLLFLSVAALVFCSRLPFVGPGYGSDADAWRIALAGRIMAARGGYTVSRFPGYPVPEISSALLWRWGPPALNGATALLSALAAGLFALSLRALRCKDTWAAASALAFTPVVFVNSTNSMDYVWALAFILAALHLSILDYPLSAGLCLGLAIGCRMTSALMLLPLALSLGASRPGRGAFAAAALPGIRRLSLAAFLSGAAAYLPAFLEYGWRFLRFSEGSRPAVVQVLGRATTGVWGQLGAAALLAGTSSLLFGPLRRAGSSSIPQRPEGHQLIAWSLAVCFYLAAFLLLPLDPGYLIPIVPFVILLLARLLDRRVFLGFCLAATASSIIALCRGGVCGGPIFYEQAARRAGMRQSAEILSRARSMHEKSLIVVGPRGLPPIKAGLPLESIDSAGSRAPATNECPAFQGPVKFVAYLDARQLRQEREEGRQIYYLDSVREWNLSRTGLDLLDSGARPLSLHSSGSFPSRNPASLFG